jgi:hypothetical protein
VELHQRRLDVGGGAGGGVDDGGLLGGLGWFELVGRVCFEVLCVFVECNLMCAEWDWKVCGLRPVGGSVTIEGRLVKVRSRNRDQRNHLLPPRRTWRVRALMSVLLPAFMTPNTPMLTLGTSDPAAGDAGFFPASAWPPLLLGAGAATAAAACWRAEGEVW